MSGKHRIHGLPVILAFGAIAAAGYALSRTNYLLFHTSIELSSVTAALAVFMLAWNARRLMDNQFLLFVGAAYAAAACLDLVHTLTYQGMGVFPGAGANPPTQLWIAARSLQAAALLVAPLFLWRNLRAAYAIPVLAACVAALLLAIFRQRLGLAFWPAFPTCYVDGLGLTPFKIIAEYVICAVLAAALGLLTRLRGRLAPDVFRLVALSIAFTIASELSLTQYVSVYGPANMLGHLFKLAAFYLVYRAIVATGLARPYDLLFRDLQHTEQALRELNQTLEQRVAQRTAEVQKQSDQLRALAAELSRAEHRERKRLARILHDHIQQLIVAARMHLESIGNNGDTQRVKAAAQGADDILHEALLASRDLTMDLSPPALHEEGLAGGLNWLANRMQEKQQFTVHLHADDGAEPPAEDIRLLLFECARELLFNAAKHAGVSRAEASLVRGDPDGIRLIIADEGKGFDPEQLARRDPSRATFGLFSIQQRLAHVGGHMQIDAAPGKGTRVTLTWPARAQGL